MANVNIENIARSAAETSTIAMFEYYRAIEESVSKIQAQERSYRAITQIKSTEIPNGAADLTFQISPTSK